MRLHNLLLCWSLATLLVSPLVAQDVAGHPVGNVNFNRDIRPLLSDRCFKCHGFDKAQRKAGLRLDTSEGIFGALEQRHPVVPGDLEHSTVIARIRSTEQNTQMPPPDSGLSLSDAERELIARWIVQGAPFEPHWAFVPPTRRPRLSADSAASPNPIDAFIAEELKRFGLTPSEEADRQTLIRRITLDLTGLPPTLEQIAAFVEDPRDDAYERLVDRLLASKSFGERMALMWLDIARYADTNGFHHDNVRTAWPYRDWVINAFNENKPYDQFVVEQLAGDLLPGATDQERIASAFCRMHNINDEGGALDPEYRFEAISDRIETISTAFMGLTFTCSRCHDHKYDPITQEDYYSLAAFFNSIEERGVYPNNGEQARAYPARLLYRPADLDARTAAAEQRRDAAQAQLDAAGSAIQQDLNAWETALRNNHGIEWLDLAPNTASAASGKPLSIDADGAVSYTADSPDFDTHVLTFETNATGIGVLRLEALADATNDRKVGLAPNGNAVLSQVAVTVTSLVDPKLHHTVPLRFAWATHEQQNGDFDVQNLLRDDRLGWALEGHRKDRESRLALFVPEVPFGFDGGSRIEIKLAYQSAYPQHIIGRVRIRFARGEHVLHALPVVASDWWSTKPYTGGEFDKLFDRAFGPENAKRLHGDESKIAWTHRPELKDGEVHALSGERRAFYFARTLTSPVAHDLDLSFGSDDAIKAFLNGNEILSDRALRGAKPDQNLVKVHLEPGENLLVVKVINNGGPGGIFTRLSGGTSPDVLAPIALLPEAERQPEWNARFKRELATKISPTYAKLRGTIDAIKRELEELAGEAVPVVVMKELAEPTKTFVSERGAYDGANPKRPVTRRPPLLLGGRLEDGAPNNRLGFARWLVRPDHPLTARVHVNRLFEMLFGAGIVETSENFGQQAAWPSHLDLLDWLATTFVASGWDQKRLLRQMVLSHTYRQSSRTPEAAKAIDPNNRLLGWFPRRRLKGEFIRDAALFNARLLSDRLGGPSVKPYQPEGLWREVSIGGSSNTSRFVRDEGEALYRRSLYTFWKRTSPNPQMSTFDVPTREFCVVRRGTTNTPLQALVLWNDEQFVEAARELARHTLAESRGDRSRLANMFARCTGRSPEEGDYNALLDALRYFRSRYAGHEADARALLSVGTQPLPDGTDVAELAAWTLIGNTILSLDATVTRN